MSTLYYSEEELKNILHYKELQNKIFLPNEIFEELKENIDLSQPNRSCEHIAFAYCYVYLISYLFRYAKYITSSELITEKILKQILQTPETYTHKNYITKKDGILAKLKYIEKSRKIPYSYYFDIYGDLHFTLWSEEIDSEMKNTEYDLPRNYRINYPYRAFTRYFEEDDDEAFDGYFFDIYNTHLIPVEVFIFCMSKKDLGTVGFYLYAYLKHMSDLFPKGWSCSFDKLKALTGLKKTTLQTILKELESYNMIYNSHATFYVHLYKLGSDIKPVPNKYRAKSFERFTHEKKEVIVRHIEYLQDRDSELEDIQHDYHEFVNDDSHEVNL